MVEVLLFERGIDICHVRWNQFGPMFADVLRIRREALALGYTAAFDLSRGLATYAEHLKSNPR
jgi:hypothetical protein